MSGSRKAAYTAQVKRQANEPKRELIALLDKLESEGLKVEAARLGQIIGNLEHWQSTGRERT